MQYSGSDLENLVPLWERKLSDRVDQPISDRVVRRDVHVFGASVSKDALRNAGPLAQDAFSALLVSQGGVKRTL